MKKELNEKKLILNNFILPSWNKMYAGIFWSERKKIVDDIHELVFYEAKKQKLGKIKGRVKLNYHIVWKGNKERDLDNVPIKLITDGLVKAGVLEGDSLKFISELKITGEKGKENNLIILKIIK